MYIIISDNYVCMFLFYLGRDGAQGIMHGSIEHTHTHTHICSSTLNIMHTHSQTHTHTLSLSLSLTHTHMMNKVKKVCQNYRQTADTHNIVYLSK